MAIRLWGNTRLVNTTTANGQADSSVVGLKGGGYVVVWVDDMGAGASVVKFQRYDAMGVKQGAETTLSNDGSGDQLAPSITALDDGGFAIACRDEDPAGLADLRVSRFSATGVETFGLELASASSTIVNRPIIVAQGTGYAVVTSHLPTPAPTGHDVQFLNFSNNNIFFAGVVDGSTLDTSFVGAQGSTDSTTYNAAYVDTTDFTDLVTSATFTTSIRIEDSSNFAGTGNIIDALTSGDYQDVSIQESANGFVVSSLVLSGGGLLQRVKLFPFPGLLTSGVTVQVATLVSPGHAPQTTILPDGTVAVVFMMANNLARVDHYSAFGSLLGSTILNEITDASTEIDIGVLADGRLVATWTNFTAVDGSGNGVFQQILDTREGVVDGNNLTAVDETLVGNDLLNDQIRGFGGIDNLFGLAGNDTIYGGSGNDNLFGGRGDDTVFGGNDTDNLFGDLGDDEQYGEGGNDIVWSGAGADLMDGGSGTGDAAFYTNELTGAIINLTDQTFNAGAALGDTLFNFERIFGSVRGANDLTGDANANILVGGQVNDIMRGGANADVLRGGIGVDTMAGGTQNDIFQYTGNNEGGDVITDFAAGDKFQFVRTAFGNLAGANVAAANFLSVASGHVATTASQRFIFDQATKQLWYDSNGNVAGGDVMIADLSTSYNILNTDLLLA